MDAHSPALNFFTEQGINSGILQSQFIEHLPISSHSEAGYTEFNLTSPDFIDLSRSRILVKCKVVCGDGTDMPVIANEAGYATGKGDCFLVNNFIDSIFDKVEFSIQGQNLTNDIPNHMYPFKSYIDTLLSETKEENMARLFVKDAPKSINACSVWKALDTNEDNTKDSETIKKRSKVIQKSREFQMIGSLGVDFCKQSKYLLNNMNISIKFWQSGAPFSLLSASTDVNHKVKITDIRLILCHVKLTNELFLAVNESVKVHPVSYPFKKSIMKSYSIAKGMQSVTLNDIFSGKCPDKIIIAMTTTKQFLGSYQSNPYFFQNFKLNEVGLYVNNVSLPGKPLTLDFNSDAFKSNFAEAFERLKSFTPIDNTLNYEDFHRGTTLIAMDLTNGESGDLLAPVREGQTRLELRFAEALSEPINILIYGKDNACLTVDHARNATLTG